MTASDRKDAEAPRIALKAVRTEAGLSLAQAAAATGVSKAMLGQIERGESSPTLTTLWKLARGFHLPLSAFIEGLGSGSGSAAGQETPASPAIRVHFDESISFEPLFPFDPALGSESFLIDLRPGQTHVSHPHDLGVIEDIFVTQGIVELELDEKWTRYETGQAVRFAAKRPHSYRNPAAEPARFHNTIHYSARPGLHGPR